MVDCDHHPVYLPALTVFEIEKGTRVLTHSPNALDTNAANPVAINRYQFVRLFPARVVGVVITNYVNHLLIIFLPRFGAWLLHLRVSFSFREEGAAANFRAI